MDAEGRSFATDGRARLSSRCRLKLQSEQFKLDLEGDADLIRHAYASLRDEILRRLMLTPRSAVGATLVNPALQTVEQSSLSPSTPNQDYVWVYRCNDLYCKVGVAERKSFEQSTLGRLVNPWKLRGVYLEGGEGGQLSELVPAGKTLWSELTAVGRERLRKR